MDVRLERVFFALTTICSDIEKTIAGKVEFWWLWPNEVVGVVDKINGAPTYLVEIRFQIHLWQKKMSTTTKQ